MMPRIVVFVLAMLLIGAFTSAQVQQGLYDVRCERDPNNPDQILGRI